MDTHALTGRSIGDPFPQYVLKSQLGSTLSPGAIVGDILYWDGTQWVANSDVSVQPGASISISTTASLNDGEFVGNWIVHGTGSADKLSVNKVGPGAKIFGVDTTGDRVLIYGSPEVTRTAVSSSPYAVAARDCLLSVSTAAARTINLPAASGKQRLLVIKDAVGAGAAVNNITVTPNGGDTIDQVAASLTVNTTRAAVRLYSDGTSNWEVL
jgi:hypothetical protein